MADKGKPSLDVIIAQSKKAPGGGGKPPVDDDSDYDGSTPSAEMVSCVRQMGEAMADGDYEGAAKALEAAMGHASPPAAEDTEEME